jgi:hypothetical protein
MCHSLAARHVEASRLLWGHVIGAPPGGPYPMALRSRVHTRQPQPRRRQSTGTKSCASGLSSTSTIPNHRTDPGLQSR